jgi:hypothetical protein
MVEPAEPVPVIDAVVGLIHLPTEVAEPCESDLCAEVEGVPAIDASAPRRII